MRLTRRTFVIVGWAFPLVAACRTRAAAPDAGASPATTLPEADAVLWPRWVDRIVPGAGALVSDVGTGERAEHVRAGLAWLRATVKRSAARPAVTRLGDEDLDAAARVAAGDDALASAHADAQGVGRRLFLIARDDGIRATTRAVTLKWRSALSPAARPPRAALKVGKSKLPSSRSRSHCEPDKA